MNTYLKAFKLWLTYTNALWYHGRTLDNYNRLVTYRDSNPEARRAVAVTRWILVAAALALIYACIRTMIWAWSWR